MTRETMLDAMIDIYGFEHEEVIKFARLVESPDIPDEELSTLLLIHQECPIEDED